MKVNRGPAPAFLSSQDVKLAIEKMEIFYSLEDRDQTRYDFPFNKAIDMVLKEHMRGLFFDKCWYCEVKIIESEDGVIDRYRPHSGVRDRNEYYSDLYWWLTFEWDNLIYCCKECFQYKANYFPIKSRRAMSKEDSLDAEDPLLFDPCKDDRDFHFNYEDNGEILPWTEKGSQTIDLLRLDRVTHRERRAKDADSMRTYFHSVRSGDMDPVDDELLYFSQLYDGDPSIEFLSFKQMVLVKELENWTEGDKPFGLSKRMNLDEMIARESKSIYSRSDVIKNDFFPIESIHIQNFKGITDLTINFKEDKADKKSWLFLLGENGVGKSSILQAIAVGMSADTELIVPLIPQLIQKGEEEAKITIKERNSDNEMSTVLRRVDNSIEQRGNFKSFLFGYGSLRLSVSQTQDSGRLDKDRISYENLFIPTKPLNDITKWLKDLYPADLQFFNTVAYSIRQLLPHDFAQNKITVEEGEIMFGNSEKSFSELSDGFKSTIILAVDIMMKLSSAKADMDKMTGIVVIDELGNQLHPRWQMRIVTQLREAFPGINFIISTHHPLCLRGSEEGEILLLRNANGRIEPVTDLPNPVALRVDQILASEFFGLNTLIDPDLEASFNRYYQLLAKEEKISDDERKELIALKDELRGERQLGSSLREELMYTVIDNLLASNLVYNKTSLKRQDLEKEVLQRVKDIWDKLNTDSNDQS